MDLKLKNKGEKLTQKMLDYKAKKNLSFDDIALEIGIAKMTLFKRKKDHDWTLTEAFFIQEKF